MISVNPSSSINYWTALSIEYATQRSYLDDLFRVYPTIPDGIRTLDTSKWEQVEQAYSAGNNEQLIRTLLSLDLFPIKDSYTAFLKRNPAAVARNPKTINRICGRLYEMGLDKIYERCSEPKETNLQIGPFFKRWLDNKSLGLAPIPVNEFLNTSNDAILSGSDKELMDFAREKLNYQRDKGLDFVARFGGKYVIGEAKFLTDFGGHQNAQFADAMATLTTPDVAATIIAILDGVVYIPGKNKLYTQITQQYAQFPIMSALVLKDFLYQL